MKFFITSLFIIFFTYLSKSQIISIGSGPIFTHTNQKVKMVNSKEDFQNTGYQFCLAFEYFLKNDYLSLIGSYTKFNGSTWIKFREGSVVASDGFPTLGVGYSGVVIHRLNLAMTYNLFNVRNRFFVKPIISIGLQNSNPDGSEYGAFERQNGPEYFELEPITAETFKTTQFVPSVGIRTGVLLWGFLEFGLEIMGALGSKSYQNMNFKYMYKGNPQETAVFEAKGTGIFTTFSIGYKFGKEK
jgi:hypothetical protein